MVKGKVNSVSVISERGYKAIFEGEIVTHLRRDGTQERCEVLGFRLEDARVMSARDILLNERTRTAPDVHGIYKAKVVFGEVCRKATTSAFFPVGWTREQVEQAIVEAYQSALPHRFHGAARYKGVTEAGLRIVLRLDESGLVVDAMPVYSGVNRQRALAWALEMGRVPRKRYCCASCGAVKVRRLVCPEMHSQDVRQPSRSVAALARRYARRLWRLAIMLRAGLRCSYCGVRRPAAVLTLDHVMPRSRGGRSTWRNLVACCVSCNTRKGNKTPQEAGFNYGPTC
jgi:5-methylcytosine-specific restriction endonuclease McrA